MTIEIRKPLRLRKTAGNLAQALTHLLWPAACLNCARTIPPANNALCSDCWTQLSSCCSPDYCRRCGRDAVPDTLGDPDCPRCQTEDISLDGIARAGVYSAVLRNIILSFKHSHTELDIVLGSLLRSAMQTNPFLNDIRFFVPVPLHWFKRLRRGYNQSALLANAVRPDHASISTDLVRIRHTKPQPAMPSPAARAENVAGAFAVRLRHPFEGKNLCLVDDVKTTGATLNECARTLKQAGASKVYALVLAVAGQDTA